MKYPFIILILLLFFSANIMAQTIKPSTNQSPYLKIGTGSSCYVSGVIGDPTDPASTEGILFDVTGTVSLSATSDKTKIVDNEGLAFETITANHQYRLKITAKATGYAKITVKNGSKSFTINYAASTEGVKGSYWPTGMSDASAAVIIGDYLVVADDETNSLRIIRKGQSGMPVAEKDFASSLKVSGEMDTEAATQGQKYPDHYYFVASMGQNKSGNDKPDHNRIWAVQNKATSGVPNLSFVAYTDKMRAPLVSWIKSNYGNSAVDETIAPKNENGFNIEGFAIGTDFKGYIGFRAPLIFDNGKKKALIASIPEFEDALLGKNSKSMTNIASYLEKPILLDLDGRGIRSMEQLDNGVFIIIAGGCGDEDSDISSRLYAWNGDKDETPVLLEDYPLYKHKSTAELNPEGMVIRNFDSQTGEFTIDLIHDKGTADFYNESKEAKDLKYDEHKKYRIDVLTYKLPEKLSSGFNSTSNANEISVYPNPAKDVLFISGNIENKKLSILNSQGIKLIEKSETVQIDVSKLNKGLYIFSVEGQKNIKFTKE